MKDYRGKIKEIKKEIATLTDKFAIKCARQRIKFYEQQIAKQLHPSVVFGLKKK